MDSEDVRYLVWLASVPGIGTVTANRLLGIYGSAEAVYNAPSEDLYRTEFMGDSRIRSIISHSSTEAASAILESCDRKGIGIHSGSSFMDRRLCVLGDETPLVIYTRGQLRDSTAYAGIVGPRRCTQDEKLRTAELAESCAGNSVTVISGMAKGVDSYAHTACLNSGGYTIAVLGNGCDICYPKEHSILMESIIEYGLVISEYPPGTPPARYSFPRRNRIIAALSDTLYMIRPARKSGTESTYAYARGLDRKVICF